MFHTLTLPEPFPCLCGYVTFLPMEVVSSHDFDWLVSALPCHKDDIQPESESLQSTPRPGVKKMLRYLPVIPQNRKNFLTNK